MFKRTKVSAGVLIAIGSAVAATSVPAFGQDTQRIEITGSRILSTNAISPAPVQVISAEEIAASGVTNIQDLLLKNPTFGVPSISRTNSNFATSSSGVSTIDLRNLGTARTLVLINGRRVVSGVPGDQSVDLNTIPAQFVERIEILTGGASATYGSDAVAGVVNIILKRDFEGFNIDVKTGQSEKGDDKRDEVAMTFGTISANGKGRLMGHFGFSDQGAVMSRDRSYSAVDQASRGAFITGDPADFFTIQRPFYSSFAPQGRIFHGSGNVTFDRDGNLIPWSTNGSPTLAATGFNRSEFRSIAVPTKRFLLGTKGEYEFAQGHRVFLEGTYAQTQTKSELEPFPLGAEDIFPATGGQVPAEFNVNGTVLRNPLVPDAIYSLLTDTDGDGLRDYYFTRRLSEVGNRGNTADRDTFRIMTGVNGDISAKWSYDLYAGFGSTKEAQVSGGQVNVLTFKSALEGIPDVNDIDGDGNVTEAICMDASARAQGCVPLSVFGYNSITPQALAYVTAPGLLATYTSQKVAGGSVSGEVFQMPAGPVGLAAGFEYRKEYSRAEFDPLQSAGLNAGNALPRTEGSFDVKELFAEARMPLLSKAAFAKSLNVTAAIRGGDYSTVGSTLSWTTGLDWSVNDSVKLRATRALATRAPNINELYSPPSQTFPTGLNDPCNGVTATTVGAIADNCRADPGVAANIAANGAFTLNQADLQGISGFNRGNPALQEEKGNSWTLGLALTPKGMGFLDKFNFTLDYFNVEIEDAIVSTPRQFILDQCYQGDASFCNFITRRAAAVGANSAGSIDLIDSAVTNSGALATEGVDVTVNFADRVGPGRLSTSLTYTRLLDGYNIPLPGSAKDPFAGEIGAPKDKFSLNLGYSMKNWKLGAQITYIGASNLDDQFLAGFEDANGDPLKPGSYGVGSKTYTDVSASYAVGKGWEIYGGIYNLFGTKPAPVISGLPGNDTGTETNAGTYDAIGRRYYIGVRASF